MDKPIDSEFKAINNPAGAVDYYLPFLISKKLDLSQIRQELRAEHQFSEEDIKIAIHVLSSQQFKYDSQVPDLPLFMLYVILAGGCILILAGLFFTLILWEMRIITLISVVLISAGVLLVFKTNKQILLKKQFSN